MEHLPVLCVVLNSMTRENLLPHPKFLEKRGPGLFVHEFAVNLMLYERHQNNHRRKPSCQ